MKVKVCVARPDPYEALCEAAGTVSRETFERLQAFESRFRQWNSRINLVADSTLNEFWSRHVIDSAQLINLARAPKQWLDLGSGGGFPGLIVAFLLPAGSRISLVESNRKKAGFLSAMAGEFRLPVDVHAVRIEDALTRVAQPDVVSARALAALPLLLDLSAHWLQHGAKAIFHKGRDYRSEVTESQRKWHFDLIEHVSVTDAASVVLEISDLKPVLDK